MHSITIPYPDDLLIASGQSRKNLEAEMRFLLAAKLFEIHRLTLGKAAMFCGMNKTYFMFELGRLGIPIINLASRVRTAHLLS